MQYIACQKLRTNVTINKFGVPLDSSNLESLLFLIYIDDLPNALRSLPRLFADDKCSVMQSSSPLIMEEKINQELVNVNTIYNISAQQNLHRIFWHRKKMN